MRYYAYGSNMCSNRLRARVPSSRFVAVATLAGHRLRFHKGGRHDGSGKCNAFRTGVPGDLLHGVLYEMDEAQKRDLDRIEGVGFGYRSLEVAVSTAAGECLSWIYVAEERAIDDTLVPYRWYRDFVASGAREHGLPEAYVRAIEAVRALEDPDRDRARRARMILEGRR